MVDLIKENRMLKRIVILCLIFTLGCSAYAKGNKEAEQYYKQGLAINKTIKQSKKVNPNIDCSTLEQQAIDNFTKAIELNPEYTEAYYARAEKNYKYLKDLIVREQLYYPDGITQDEFTDQILADYDKVLEAKPSNTDVYCKKVFLKLFLVAARYDGEYNEKKTRELEQKYWENIYEDINKIISINPMCANAYFLKGILEGFFIFDYDLKNNKYIIEKYDEFMESSTLITKNKREHYEYLHKNSIKSAIQDFSTALSLNPRHSLAYVYRAYFRKLLGDFQGCIDDLSSAITIEPYNAQFYVLRADDKFYLKQDYKGAYKDYIIARNLSIKNNSKLYARCIDMIECLEKYHLNTK